MRLSVVILISSAQEGLISAARIALSVVRLSVVRLSVVILISSVQEGLISAAPALLLAEAERSRCYS